MSKFQKIELAEALLVEQGFKKEDWVISLQGPTVIFTMTGVKALEGKPEVKERLLKIGMEIL
jgi:hypothetical protein